MVEKPPFDKRYTGSISLYFWVIVIFFVMIYGYAVEDARLDRIERHLNIPTCDFNPIHGICE